MTPEAAYVGLNPDRVRLAPGVLAVAAFDVEPPARSVHFHLSMLSLCDGRLGPPAYLPTPAEAREILNRATALNSRKLTVVEGDLVDHGLVWEDGSIDLHTTSPDQLTGSLISHLPQGDGEPMLRRFIDDSINLLEELEVNRRRREEDLPPLSCLWPWGQGLREPVPNLFIERGEQVQLESHSIRIEGLSKLVHYRHGDRRAFGSGTSVRLASLAGSSARSQIVVIEDIATFRRNGQVEEAGWLTREIDRVLFAPLVEASRTEQLELLIAAPGREGGLCLRYRSVAPDGLHYPFDERALEDSRLSTTTLHEAVAETLISG